MDSPPVVVGAARTVRHGVMSLPHSAPVRCTVVVALPSTTGRFAAVQSKHRAPEEARVSPSPHHRDCSSSTQRRASSSSRLGTVQDARRRKAQVYPRFSRSFPSQNAQDVRHETRIVIT